jgi:hypothetical protein
MLLKNTQYIILSWQELEQKLQYLAERIENTKKPPIAIQPLSKECFVAAYILAEMVDGTVSPLGNITFDLTDSTTPDYCLYLTEKASEHYENKKESYATDTLYFEHGKLQSVKYPWKRL